MSGSKDKHGGVAVDHSRQLPRLKRIEGQIRGLQQMIQDGRYCGDVVEQINAAIAALRKVQTDMVRDHLQACAQASASSDLSELQRKRLSEEMSRLLGKLS